MAARKKAKRRFGTTRKLPSGAWQARYTGSDGQRHKAPHTFPTKTAAEEWLVETEADLLRGAWIDPDAGLIPLDEYAEQWIKERGLADRTAELYRAYLRNHIGPYLGDVMIGDLKPPRVRSWRATLLNHTGESTVAKVYSLLRAIMNTAEDDELIRRNPCRIRGAGQARTPERPTATLPEVFAIAHKIQPRYEALVLLATFGQLRFGELMALRRADLRVPATGSPVVKVRRAVSQLNSGTQTLKAPKGSEAGIRPVTLPEAIAPELRRHLKHYAEPGDDGRVFIGPKGGTARRSNFNRIWKRALRESGANPELHLHDLRHTGGTLSAQTGATVREVMKRMGHSTTRAAMIYQHATDERDAKIAEALNLMITEARAAADKAEKDPPAA